MNLLNTLIYSGDPVLNTACENVNKNDEVKFLIDCMWLQMYGLKGIGLAANQVGVLKRVIVVHADSFKKVMINPEITKSYGGKITARETCLSFPGKEYLKVRDKQIIIHCLDENFKEKKYKLKV